MSLKRRMDAIERTQLRRQRREVEALARELGLTPTELLDEAEAFLAQPLADQLAEVDRINANMAAAGESWDDVEDIKATLERCHHER